MSNFKPIHLKIFKSKDGSSRILTDETGVVINENQTVKLIYGTLEWANWLVHLRANGIIKIDIIGFIKEVSEDDGKLIYEGVPKEIQEEIQSHLVLESKAELTPEQKEIAELKAMIMAMKEGPKSEPKQDIDPEIVELRKKYFTLNGGKKGSPKWDAETLKEKIAGLE